MIVCLCYPTNDRDIEECIRDGARSVDDIGEMCGAGTGCGACREELRERLERAGICGEPDRGSERPRGCTSALVPLRSRQAA